MASNASVLKSCQGFLESMSRITRPDDLAVELFSHTDVPEALTSMAQTVAKGKPSSAPVSLTVASSSSPTFEVRGNHAYATLNGQKGWGGIVLIIITVAVLLIAIVLCRAAR